MAIGEQQAVWVRQRVYRAHLQIQSYPVACNSPIYKIVKSKESNDPYEPYGPEVEPVKGRQTVEGKSVVPLPPWALGDAKVVRVVNGLPDGQRHWLRYAYRGYFNWADEAGVVKAVWQAILPELKGLRAKKREKLKAIAYLCVQDAKSQRADGKALYRPVKMQELLKVSACNWARDWRPYWERMQDILSTIDRQALATVLEAL